MVSPWKHPIMIMLVLVLTQTSFSGMNSQCCVCQRAPSWISKRLSVHCFKPGPPSAPNAIRHVARDTYLYADHSHSLLTHRLPEKTENFMWQGWGTGFLGIFHNLRIRAPAMTVFTRISQQLLCDFLSDTQRLTPTCP